MKKAIFIIALMVACVVEARPWILLFGSEGCEECAEIKEIWSEQQDENAPVLVYVSIDKEENYLFLKKVEKTLAIQRTGSSFPIVLAGKKMAHGVDGFLKLVPQFDGLLEDLPRQPMFAGVQKVADEASSAFVSWNAESVTQDAVKESVATEQELHLLFLSAPGCKKCARQSVELSLLEKKLENLQIENYEVTTEKGQVYLQRVIDYFKIENGDKNLAPIVIWPNGYVTGRLAEAEELLEALNQEDAKKTPFWNGEITEQELAALKSRQDNFLGTMTWATVVWAGLLDGINPCAFATVIFLISYLLMLKRGKRFILGAGICFCTGVFISYFLFGIGLSFIVDYINQFKLVRPILYLVFAAIGFACAVMHLRDAVRFNSSGKESDMDMRLDKATHRKIHDKIHKWSKIDSWLIWPAAIVLGVVVSSLEFVCTGQVYLPTIMAINSAGFNFKAMCGLLGYNIAFILPLVAVTCLAFGGIGAKAIGDFARKHIVFTKTAMAIMFLLLGALMTYIGIHAL